MLHITAIKASPAPTALGPLSYYEVPRLSGPPIHDTIDQKSFSPPTAPQPDTAHPKLPSSSPSLAPTTNAKLSSQLHTLNEALTHVANSVSEHALAESHQGQPASSTNHGNLFSTVLKQDDSPTTLKTINVYLTPSPHAPIFLCIMHNDAETKPPLSLSRANSPPVVAHKHDIKVICCQQHTHQMSMLYPNATVSFVTTLNARFNARSPSPDQPLSDSDVTVSTTDRKQDETVPKPSYPPPLDYATALTRPAQTPVPDTDSPSPSHPTRPHPTIPAAPSTSRNKITQTLKAPITSRTQPVPTSSNNAQPSSSLTSFPPVSTPSTFSWSDHMDELTPLTHENQAQLKIISNDNSIIFNIEIALIYARALTSPNPRKAMRGILDNTRRVSTITNGIALSFGNVKIPLLTVSMHRHQLNHSMSLPSLAPPYANHNKRECNLSFCPFNVWITLLDEHNTPENIQMTKDIFIRIREFNAQLPVTQSSVTRTQDLLALLKEHKVTTLGEFTSTCNAILTRRVTT